MGLPAQKNTLPAAVETVPLLADGNDAFTRLILLEELTLHTFLLAFAISFIWGATHALTPGHGKTIVGAYLVGSRGTIKHALYLGLTTTITHTLGVFALGLITLFAAHYLLPETLFPWLSLLSGLSVVGIGLNLFAGRIRSLKSGTWLLQLGRKPMRPPSMFSPVVQHSHAGGVSHSHPYILQTSDGHSHSHGHVHDYPHDHSHPHGTHPGHSHAPPDTITWRNLLALGVSGGLVPCPSALVVLLGAIALNKIGLGLILVLAFSLGLAGTLTAVGMLFIYAGKLFQRFPSSGRVIGVLPIASALFVSVIGVGIVIKALAEIGL